MELLVLSFVAGVLTVLSPCVVPILPVVLTGSATETKKSKPFIILASLSVSIIVFTLLLKASTALLSIPDEVWLYVAGSIVLLFGVTLVWPQVWEALSLHFNLLGRSNQLAAKTNRSRGPLKDVLLGASLGPIFSSCSPTYAVILASVLPVSFTLGLVYLIAYVLGLALVMLPIAYGGQRVVAGLRWATDPKGNFKRGLGIVMIILGLAIITGLVKDFETFLLDSGWLNLTELEFDLLDR